MLPFRSEPGIIWADEPASDLDGENTAAAIALLRQAADRGAAVLLVTHALDTLEPADAVYHMEHGTMRGKYSPNKPR